MTALHEVSIYAKMISPFLAAMLSAMTAYESRHARWRFVGGVLVMLVLIVVGCANIFLR
jgi:hypothetical protein